MTKALDPLLTVLQRAGLQPTAAEVADLIWLALHTAPPRAARKKSSTRQPESGPKDTTASDKEFESSSKERRPRYRSSQPSKTTELYPRGGPDAGSSQSASPVRVPAIPKLPDALAIGRALRPLHRKIPDLSHYVLDAEETTERAADHLLNKHSIWQPVLKPAQQRWLELALVIDIGQSMVIWQPLLGELYRLFAYNGAFRWIRRWYLDTQEDQATLFAGPDKKTARRCLPNEPIVSGGWQLIVVISDGISRAWHTGDVPSLLQDWSRLAHVVQLQMLPQRMWSSTALGRGAEIRLSASDAASVNILLNEDNTESHWGVTPAKPPVAPLKLPVITLEADMVKSWAQLLTGKQQFHVAGVRFDAKTRYSTSSSVAVLDAPDRQVIKRRQRRFQASASPLAQRLAGVSCRSAIDA